MLSRRHILSLAQTIGFDLCGVAPCRHMAENEVRFRRWIERGYHSSLGYMERNADKRFDPRLLVENARTAVVCAVAYKNPASEGYEAGCRTKIASYACSRDYHLSIREMLRTLLAELKRVCPDLGGRAFVDTAPLAEKQLAVEAGLGWIGRQSLLVTPQHGTFVVLGELILDREADAYDTPFAESRCGSCRRCIEACPTGAILPDRMIDTSRCIACHTIERQPDTTVDLDGWIFGCDACQSCCPHNRHTPQHRNRAFDPIFDPTEMDAAAWRRIDGRDFDKRFGTTPLIRSGLQRIRDNIRPEQAETSGEESDSHGRESRDNGCR